MTRKILAVIATLVAPGLAQAALISFTINGTVTVPGGGLTTTSVVTATGVFDDAPLDAAGNGTILFNNGSGNTLSIDLGGLFTLTEANDVRYSTTNGAKFVFNDAASNTIGGAAALANFDYLATTPTPFGSFNLIFDDNGNTSLRGNWTSATFAPVPVPAAVWLFGSGLLGLAGIARRKRSA